MTIKSFKQYITEVENITYSSDKGVILNHLNNEKDLKEYDAEHISTTASGHKLYKYKYHGKTSYHAVNPETKSIDMGIEGKEKNDVLHKPLIMANHGNTIKAHDFLHHLITKHDKTIVVDKMSAGGKSAFQKLQNEHGKEVNIHGWHKGSPVNIHMGDEDYMHGDKDNADEKEAKETLMVAHKK